MKLPGKTALITGASRGIGRALASALAESGCALLLTALGEEELHALATELASRGASASWIAADLVDEQERESLIEWVRRHDRTPDILVNNAGCGHFGRFASSEWRDVERVFVLDAHTPTRLIHDLLPLLRSRPEAAIVNISSASARIPYPGLATYGACKAYLSSLSQTLACELDGTGIHVLCIHPGFTQTQFFSAAGMDMRRIPRWAINTPERVAGRVVRMIERNKTWGYADRATPVELAVAAMLPRRLKTKLFKNLFWTLPVGAERPEGHA
jgi:short-subunit dehydrogenase